MFEYTPLALVYNPNSVSHVLDDPTPSGATHAMGLETSRRDPRQVETAANRLQRMALMVHAPVFTEVGRLIPPARIGIDG